MLSPKDALLAALLVMTVFYAVAWVRPQWLDVAVGFVTNFLDTLGIGSFATTTSFYRLRNRMRDELIPGTLNVGHTLPTVAQALIYITLVEVDIVTLTAMIAASVAGSWLGAGLVGRLPRRQIQTGMGFALLAAAILMALNAAHALPGGGTALQLNGPKLALGVGANFILGALMTLGIGLYAPCMVLVSLLGMNPTAAFPIMMGSCAFLMPAASIRFFRSERYDLGAAIGLALGGVPAVLVAAFLVKSLPLDYVRWLVAAVAGYAAVTLVRAGLHPTRA